MATTPSLTAQQGPASLTRAMRGQTGWNRPPGALFHLVLVPPAVGLLWSYSVPGFAFFLWYGSAALLAIGAVVWAARLVAYAFGRRGSHVKRRLLWFLVAPTAGALALALIFVEMPLRARWAASRSSFERVAMTAMEEPGYSTVERRRLGLYEVTAVYRQNAAVIFYEQNGALMDDAGFAYLPEGPFAALENGGFENPQFRHLGGPWYAWTASW